MKLKDLDREFIRKKSGTIQSLDELTDLLNFIAEKKFPSAIDRIVFRPKDLTYYAFGKKSAYKSFTIPKKNGTKRIIDAPDYKLKTIQKCFAEFFSILHTTNKYATGFLPGKSILTNAERHVGKNFILNIDLKDFFPSISFRRVKTMLSLPPFSFDNEREQKDDEKKGREYLGYLIANLCCNKGALPQGAPTSPILTNIVCQRLDRKLGFEARKYKATYSRYADDITFSAQFNPFDKKFKKTILEIIESEGFSLNKQKERTQTYYMRQEVTGITVNQKANISKKHIKNIRYWLMVWRKYGVERAQKDFAERREQHESYAIDFRNYLKGLINYAGMIKGQHDLFVLRSKLTFNYLLERKENTGLDLNLKIDQLKAYFGIIEKR